MNGGFASQMPDEFFKVPTLWIHGHTHTRFDYQVEGCRIVCNPRGYPLRSGGGFEVDGFDRFRDLVEGVDLQVFDFYFELERPSIDCPDCAGTGKNKLYAELAAAFYTGQGRSEWNGWGEGLLTEEEVKALVDNGRLWDITRPFVEGVTITKEDLFSKYEIDDDALVKHIQDSRIHVLPGERLRLDGVKLKLKGYPTPQEVLAFARSQRGGIHDGINRMILIPLRAKHLGIDDKDCPECLGTGRVHVAPFGLVLNAWIGSVVQERFQVVKVNDVQPEEIEAIRTMMADHSRRQEQVVADLLSGGPVPMAPIAERKPQEGGSWGGDIGLRSAQEFHDNWDRSIPDLNVVFGFAFWPASGEHTGPVSDRIPDGSMVVSMAHPRKGAVRSILVRNVSEADRPVLGKALSKLMLDRHRSFFAWATGRKPENIPEDDQPKAPAP
jgi:hypothetical protein